MVKNLLFVVAILLLLGTSTLQVLQAQEMVPVRVFVAKDATDNDVLAIRDNIVTIGGLIRGYALGDVLVVSVPPDTINTIAALRGVVRVDLSPSPPSPAKLQRQIAVAPLSPEDHVKLMPKGGAALLTPERSAQLTKLLTPAPKASPTPLSARRSLLNGVPGPPAAVDNSLSPHFPPIGEQEGRSSCVAWAAGYYWSTYTQAADEGLDVSGTWLPRDPPCEIVTDGKFDPVKFAACLPTIKDPPRPSRATENIASPAFLYPLIHTTGYDSGGNCTDDAGAYLSDTMSNMGKWGIGSWQMKPYDPWLYESVVNEWPTEAQWIEALPRKTAQTHFFDLSTADGFANLKQHLANGNLAVAAVQQYENVMYWGWDRSCQYQAGMCPGMDSDVLYANGSKYSGGHAITIVGYDDDKGYYNADAMEYKHGALLIANSASPYWGIPNTAGGATNGFYWMAYQYAQTYLNEVTYNDDLPHYRPRLYVASQLQAPERATWGYFYGGVGFQASNPSYPVGWISPYAKYVSSSVLPDIRECVARPFESGKRIVIDLTEGFSQLNFTQPVPLLFATFNGMQAGTMGPTDFFLDSLGNGNFATLSSPDPTKTAQFDPYGTGIFDAVMCTDVLQTGDVDGDTIVDRDDVVAITATLAQKAQCRSDPRDMDRDSRITVLDARKAATRCTYAACRPY